MLNNSIAQRKPRRSSAAALVVLTFTLASPASAQTETVIHSFECSTGCNPFAGVIADPAGNLFGTTQYGGATNHGVIYKVNSSGQYTVLHNFAGSPDGRSPVSSLTRDAAGNLYGTTQFGGTADKGVVFKIDSFGQETVVYSFVGGTDGEQPYARVIQDGAGNLYGTTAFGGSSKAGIVYEIDPSGRETILHSFSGPDGYQARAGLTLDPAGNLFGTTLAGGYKNQGVVFKLDPSGRETVLHSFSGGLDGGGPSGGVIRDTNGNLYGTAYSGGVTSHDGVAYKLNASGNETVLHSFTGVPDARNSQTSLTFDSFGDLYGSSTAGGSSDNGTVFKIDARTHQEAVVYSFAGTNGANVNSLIIINGTAYGTTFQGGKDNTGVLFRLTLPPAPAY